MMSSGSPNFGGAGCCFKNIYPLLLLPIATWSVPPNLSFRGSRWQICRLQEPRLVYVDLPSIQNDRHVSRWSARARACARRAGSVRHACRAQPARHCHAHHYRVGPAPRGSRSDARRRVPGTCSRMRGFTPRCLMLEMGSFSYALIVCSHVISIPVRYWSGARRSRERSDSAREK